MTLSRRSAELLLVSDEPQHLPNSKVLVRIAAKAQTGPCVRSAILWSQEDLWPITATCLMRSAKSLIRWRRYSTAEVNRKRRRGDRIVVTALVAAHEYGYGPNAKWRLHRAMSDVRGEAEDICSYRVLLRLTLSRRGQPEFVAQRAFSRRRGRL